MPRVIVSEILCAGNISGPRRVDLNGGVVALGLQRGRSRHEATRFQTVRSPGSEAADIPDTEIVGNEQQQGLTTETSNRYSYVMKFS